MKTKAPASSSSGSAPAPRRASAFVTQTDLKRAREDALLQLRIGRTAHYYSIVLWALLFVDGFLITFSLLSSPSSIQSPAIRSLSFLYLPVAGMLLLALFGLLVKWEAYQLWPWESHFSTNVAAVGVSAVVLVLLATRITGFGPTGHLELLPWIFPLILAGSSIALVGLAMTWPGWSRRKAVAVAGALAPMALALIGYVPKITGTSWGLTLIASGSLYLFSGSLLHLMASGTEPHEAELVRTNQSRLFQLGEDIRRRTEALKFRESTVLRREADAEVAEGAAARKLRAAEEVDAQLRQLESELDTRSTRFTEEVKTSVQKIADASRALRDLSDREAEVKRREEELQVAATARKTRETSLAQSEGELGRRKLELANREKELLTRLQSIPPQEAALTQRRKEIETRMQELLRREAEVTARGGAGSKGAAAAGASKDLIGRESRVKTMEATLSEQNSLLGRRAREVDAREMEGKRLLEEAASREQKLVSRESELSHREQELGVRLEAAQQRQKQFEAALQNVQERARAMEQKEAELTGHVQGAGRTQALLEARENALRQQTQQLTALRTEIEGRERNLAEKERTVGDRESEVSLRRQELESAPLAAMPVWGPSRGMEPEEGVGIRRVAPPEGASPPPGLRPGPPPATSTRAAPVHLAGRIGTGIPRVDDLLQGGFVPGSHVMLVGPPFLGKELLLYNFLAEGLRQSEPIILITTLRSPADVAQEIGLVLPQLREYEQLGQVHWIDASNPAATPVAANGSGPVKAVVKGPADYTGILAALAVAVKRASAKSEQGDFRVAMLTLSASIAHSEERAAFGYLGNFIEILKKKKAVALYGVDPATLEAARVETALARMDGAIRFREERGKTQLQIQGLGEVATREWVEYRATNRTLNLGSFSLERIR